MGQVFEIITPLVQEALDRKWRGPEIITVQIGVKRRRIELEEPLRIRWYGSPERGKEKRWVRFTW